MAIRNYFTEKIPASASSFYDYFLEIIRQFGNAIALTDPETLNSLTYSGLSNRSEKMRGALIRLGIQHGDLIGTFVGNSSDYIIFILAATGIGAILVPLNPAYKAYEIEKYFKETSTQWLLTEEKFFDKISHFNSEIMQAKIIMIDSATETLLYYPLQYYLNVDDKTWNNEITSQFQDKPPHGSDPTLIFSTSGTTGSPKKIRLNHSALSANVELVRKAQGIKFFGKYEMVSLNGTDVVYGVLPYFHAGGMLTVFGLLGLGVQIIVNRKFDSKRFLETLKNYQVTTALLVPPVLKFLVNCPDLIPEAFYSLKNIFVGSDHIGESLIEKVKCRLPETNIIQLYGTTESGAFVSMQPLSPKGKTGSCGILLPSVECKEKFERFA